IQVNLDRDLSLTELAELAQLSSHHFGKLFKQNMGVSPHQYVLKCRIERAKELLINRQISVVEIGQLVGFYDQSHFTNVFRRYTNLTPRQYRNHF
ncbi:MAG: helix-turn-helix transcriptional regulator, partial [Waterburya sp.]